MERGREEFSRERELGSVHFSVCCIYHNYSGKFSWLNKKFRRFHRSVTIHELTTKILIPGLHHTSKKWVGPRYGQTPRLLQKY